MISRVIITVLFLLVPVLSMAAKVGIFMPNNKDAFMRLIDLAYKEDEKRFLSKQSSALGDRIKGPFNATQLIEKFSRNELSAIRELKGHSIRVTTIAEEIGEDFRKKAYIRAIGKNAFESINMYINSEDNRYLEMSRGDKVDLVCSDVSYVMHTPMLEGCEPSKDFAKKELDYTIDFPSYFDETSEIKHPVKAVMLLLYKANEKKLEKPCSVSDEDCFKAGKAIVNLKSFKPDQEFIDLLKSHEDEARDFLNFAH